MVADQAGKLAEIAAHFGERATERDELDGLTLGFADGSWLNVRPSNTEPLLRLNVEGPDEPSMAALRDEALSVIRSGSAQG